MSEGSKSRGEDYLTVKLQDIVKSNRALRNAIEKQNDELVAQHHHRPPEPHRDVHGQRLDARQHVVLHVRDGPVQGSAGHQLQRKQPEPHRPDEGSAAASGTTSWGSG